MVKQQSIFNGQIKLCCTEMRKGKPKATSPFKTLNQTQFNTYTNPVTITNLNDLLDKITEISTFLEKIYPNESFPFIKNASLESWKNDLKSLQQTLKEEDEDEDTKRSIIIPVSKVIMYLTNMYDQLVSDQVKTIEQKFNVFNMKKAAHMEIHESVRELIRASTLFLMNELNNLSNFETSHGDRLSIANVFQNVKAICQHLDIDEKYLYPTLNDNEGNQAYLKEYRTLSDSSPVDPPQPFRDYDARGILISNTENSQAEFDANKNGPRESSLQLVADTTTIEAILKFNCVEKVDADVLDESETQSSGCGCCAGLGAITEKANQADQKTAQSKRKFIFIGKMGAGKTTLMDQLNEKSFPVQQTDGK